MRFFFKRFIILAAFFGISKTKAQKLHCLKIIYAEYKAEIPKSMKSDKLILWRYAEINTDGSVKFVNLNGVFKGSYIYNMSRDEMKSFDSVFNGKRALNKFIADTNHVEGMPYGSQYCYFSGSFMNGKKDGICFLFTEMSEPFWEIEDILEDIFDNKATQTNTALKIPSQIIPQILKLHKKSKYLPLISDEPPAQMEINQ